MTHSGSCSAIRNVLNISIVAYRDDPHALKQLRDTLEATSSLRCLYLVDNGNDDRLKDLFSTGRAQYIRTSRNLGFGKAHNIALKCSVDQQAPFHLVLNPDVSFQPEALDACVQEMVGRTNVALLMPKVLYPDGSLQRLGKLLPNPLILASRRLVPAFLRRAWDKRYELQQYDYNDELAIPALSGCFMLIRTEALTFTGLFDENYFMYMEDFDLCRRLRQWGQTICWPKVSIYHAFARGSIKEFRLLKAHILSAVHYFNKWGWLWDPERRELNRKTLNELNHRGSE